MNLKADGRRRAPRAATAILAAALLSVALLASCGGGEQEQKFVANRVLVFGDETSVINTDGSKYTVNAVVPDSGTLDCSSNPIWVQFVAGLYGLVFPQCNPNNIDSPQSRIYAAVGAGVDNLADQIEQQLLDGGFDSTDLVTILIGANDVLAQYQLFASGTSQDEVVANLVQAGTALAVQVNRVADLGAKVLISTVPDMGLTPFAIKEESANPGRAATLTELTRQFNTAMRSNIQNDGRKIGLVLTDERVQLIFNNAAALGFANVTDGACAVALPNCTTETLVVDPNSTTVPASLASATTWLWADDTRLSAGGHNQLGSIAATRASNNPF